MLYSKHCIILYQGGAYTNMFSVIKEYFSFYITSISFTSKQSKTYPQTETFKKMLTFKWRLPKSEHFKNGASENTLENSKKYLNEYEGLCRLILT